MNERIKELAKQLDFPIGLTDPQWAYEEKLNTFAELIVKECVLEAMDAQHHNTSIRLQLYRHFGVE